MDEEHVLQYFCHCYYPLLQFVFSSVQQTKYRKTKPKKKDDMVQVEVVRLLLNEVINFPLHSLFMKELKTNSLVIAITYNSYTGHKHKVKAKGGDAIFF